MPGYSHVTIHNRNAKRLPPATSCDDEDESKVACKSPDRHFIDQNHADRTRHAGYLPGAPDAGF